MKVIFALFIVLLTAGGSEAGSLWVNNITVNEYNTTWNYTETFTGIDSMMYRINIDSELGNNDSFISAWELLQTDKDMRKNLRNSIDSEMDVRINKTPDQGPNSRIDVEVLDIETYLSPEIIGKTHSMETIVNRYSVAYRFKESIFSAGSIWFLGQARSPVTIVMPAGVDVVNISGMNNATENITDHTEISGFFKGITADRGEITLTLSRNLSFSPPAVNVSNVTRVKGDNATIAVATMLSKLRDASIIIAGLVIIALIYLFKVKRR